MSARGSNPADNAPGYVPRQSGSRPWRRWGFRIVAALVVPLGLLALLEFVLRLSGLGYPTSFLLQQPLPAPHFVQNNQFGWRFFGAQMARTPHPLAVPVVKPEKTVRVFVFGESAAYGDPDPSFGLARMLETLLSRRYPRARFEVLNVAMTGINSHVILPIARDCANASGDVWVVYMGNNEVVGPFGAGTVFGKQTPPLTLTRGRLALLRNRTAQAVQMVLAKRSQADTGPAEWGGMKMFLDHPVKSGDAALERVYQHFQRNLGDIVETGRRHGAAVVLSTVAVNLRSCPPFASLHKAGLTPEEKAAWDRAYQEGNRALESGQLDRAADLLRQAARMDDGFAELRFAQAECALGQNELAEAARQFEAARELDALRFRCDSRLNEIIREMGRVRARDGIGFADAERALAAASPGQLPGEEFFYDHVHLTYAGNYEVAKAIAAQVAPLLPPWVQASPHGQSWATMAECQKRLAWTRDSERAAWADMYQRYTDAPFTAQRNHAGTLSRVRIRLEALSEGDRGDAAKQHLNGLLAALEEAPDDADLHAQVATLKHELGDDAGAVLSARRATALLPSSGAAWSELGLYLAARQEFREAAACFQRAFSLYPQDVWALQNLAQALTKLGEPEEAIRQYRRALEIKPRFGMAWLGLGQILETRGQKAEAEACFRRALENRIRRPKDLATLASFCQRRGWLAEALTNYSDALGLNPGDPRLRLEKGRCLASMNRHAEAALEYAEVVRIAPTLAEGHFLSGLAEGRLGRSQEAVARFREAVRLRPDLLEARLNLGIALTKAGSARDALTEFETVLKLSPTNNLAQRYVESLQRQLQPARP